MGDFTLFGSDAFDSVPQPVLLAQDETIRYFNPAAKAAFSSARIPLSEGSVLPKDFPRSGGVAAEVMLGGGRWAVHTRSIGAGILYFLQKPEREPVLNQEQVQRLSSQLKKLLGTLSLSVEGFQHSIVETEQLRNSQWISHLNYNQQQLFRTVDHLDLYSRSDEELSCLYPPSILNLSRLCQELCELLRVPAEMAGCKVSCGPLPSGALVRANETLVRKLIYNLVSNAFQSGGDVTLLLQVSKTHAILTLEDNGRGIPPEELALLFVPKERVLDEPHHGLGLGLVICRRIAGLYGGTLMVLPGADVTRISVPLPLATPEQSKGLHSTPVIYPEQSYSQLLLELSDVLPFSCYGQEDIF